jgi:hypothetical protein
MVFFVYNQCRILYFTNNYTRKLTICDRLHWCWRKTKNTSQTSIAWNISKLWWKPFLSHIMVFYVLNQCRILYFTITIPEKWIYLGHTIRTHASPSPPYHRWSNGQHPGLTVRRTEEGTVFIPIKNQACGLGYDL